MTTLYEIEIEVLESVIIGWQILLRSEGYYFMTYCWMICIKYYEEECGW
ncbi:MAG: hypothetical protein ACI4F0_10505 [Agathobacter sp.]